MSRLKNALVGGLSAAGVMMIGGAVVMGVSITGFLTSPDCKGGAECRGAENMQKSVAPFFIAAMVTGAAMFTSGLLALGCLVAEARSKDDATTNNHQVVDDQLTESSYLMQSSVNNSTQRNISL